MSPAAPRKDAREKVTGVARYTGDIALPGMLHVALLRSPHAHARIRSLDTGAARSLDGIAHVLTADDLAGLRCYGYSIKDQPVVAVGRVRHWGEPVAAIAARDEATATAGARLVRVDYDPLPAARSGGEVCHRFHHRSGDPTAWRSCDHVFEDAFSFDGAHHLHLEPHVCVARWDRERLHVWSSTQTPFPLRGELAWIFDHPEHLITVEAPLLGGAFGAKAMCKLEPIAALLARITGRPVRCRASLADTLAIQRQHGAQITLRTGVLGDGTLVAREARITLDAGAYTDASPLVTERAGYRVAGPYRWAFVDATAEAVHTNTTPSGPFRGFGGPQATWASESQIDMIARRLGIDPYDLRMRNLVAVGEPYRPGDRGLDSDLRRGLTAAAQRIGYHDRRSGRGRGIGLSVGCKDGGGLHRPAHAEVAVSLTGEATLRCATVEMGQGVATALTQVVADVLDLPHEAVEHGRVDTDGPPFDPGTNASSSAAVMGRAVERAALDAKRQLERAGDHATGHGSVSTDPNAPPTAFWEVSWGAAEVEVDEETGEVRLLALVVGSDAGRAINRELCRGQHEGAAIMALGGALFERMAWDDTGALATRDALHYRVPLAVDLPETFESFLEEHGLGPGPSGAKGIGEGATLVVASAVANAIEDATGARVTALPMTPERVLSALTGVSRAATPMSRTGIG